MKFRQHKPPETLERTPVLDFDASVGVLILLVLRIAHAPFPDAARLGGCPLRATDLINIYGVEAAGAEKSLPAEHELVWRSSAWDDHLETLKVVEVWSSEEAARRYFASLRARFAGNARLAHVLCSLHIDRTLLPNEFVLPESLELIQEQAANSVREKMNAFREARTHLVTALGFGATLLALLFGLQAPADRAVFVGFAIVGGFFVGIVLLAAPLGRKIDGSPGADPQVLYEAHALGSESYVRSRVIEDLLDARAMNSRDFRARFARVRRVYQLLTVWVILLVGVALWNNYPRHEPPASPPSASPTDAPAGSLPGPAARTAAQQADP